MDIDEPRKKGSIDSAIFMLSDSGEQSPLKPPEPIRVPAQTIALVKAKQVEFTSSEGDEEVPVRSRPAGSKSAKDEFASESEDSKPLPPTASPSRAQNRAEIQRQPISPPPVQTVKSPRVQSSPAEIPARKKMRYSSSGDEGEFVATINIPNHDACDQNKSAAKASFASLGLSSDEDGDRPSGALPAKSTRKLPTNPSTKQAPDHIAHAFEEEEANKEDVLSEESIHHSPQAPSAPPRTNILSDSGSSETLQLFPESERRPRKLAVSGSPRRALKDDPPAKRIRPLAEDREVSLMPSLMELDDSDAPLKQSSKGSKPHGSVLASARLLPSRGNPVVPEMDSEPSFSISTISMSASARSQKRRAVPEHERFDLRNSSDSGEETPPRFVKKGDELEELFPRDDDIPSPRAHKSKTRLTFLEGKRKHSTREQFGSDDGELLSTGPEPLRLPPGSLNPANIARQFFGKG
jgi:hypothetical protein